MNNIILFATYWNEKDWIDLSLRQIELIDPVEVIICDGCFDARRENRSTDGTREKIAGFVKRRQEAGKAAAMISAERVSRRQAPLRMLAGLSRGGLALKPLRVIRALRQGLLKNLYRVNQGLTFGKMIQLSQKWQPGRWVMTYDADQFYPEEMIEKFSITNEENDFGLLAANELTFLHSLDEYVDGYEKRTWNNMPHKIYPNTAIYPIRHWFLEGPLQVSLYHKKVKARRVGVYFHYKFQNYARTKLAYQVGDRTPPKRRQFENPKKFTGQHPKIIMENHEKIAALCR